MIPKLYFICLILTYFNPDIIITQMFIYDKMQFVFVLIVQSFEKYLDTFFLKKLLFSFLDWLHLYKASKLQTGQSIHYVKSLSLVWGKYFGVIVLFRCPQAMLAETTHPPASSQLECTPLPKSKQFTNKPVPLGKPSTAG